MIESLPLDMLCVCGHMRAVHTPPPLKEKCNGIRNMLDCECDEFKPSGTANRLRQARFRNMLDCECDEFKPTGKLKVRF